MKNQGKFKPDLAAAVLIPAAYVNDEEAGGYTKTPNLRTSSPLKAEKPDKGGQSSCRWL
jgi:hypothetical protein